ncbi:hypothetical protein EXU30_00070 [Shewanella maritima]|uniref:Uncharacterized protein n=1 Tax=Shewanella maritima TaxID=2520507 RepID=A0A411PCI0_9GAMM|nr:hypothetical protein [Shewanella maritima]QBF81265.1 hypothetical protein EXU30_00070 [Shewanella maritima]
MTMPNMSNSSAASSGTGDQANNAAFQGGNVNFGAGSAAKGISPWAIVILCVIAAVVLMKSPKK